MSRQGAVLCPGCRKLVNADEPRCPYCGIAQPGSGWLAPLRRILHAGSEDAVRYIIYANVVMFVLSLVLAPGRIGMSANPLGFLSPSNSSLLLLGATGTIPIDQLHRWWSLLTANYLHGGVLHIFFNMAALNQLGPVVVREYGLNRMLVLYTLGGVAGYVVSYFAAIPLTIGASASLCSLIGALLYYGRDRGGTYGQLVFQRVWGWALGIFFFGLLVPGINNWGHGGGMAGGFLLASLLGYQEKRRETSTHRMLAAACMLGTLAALAWAILAALYLRIVG